MVFSIIGYTYITPSGTNTTTTAVTSPTFVSPGGPASEMVGLAYTVTPLVHGIIKITIDGSLRTAVSSGDITLQINYGTGSAPAANAAATGTVIGDAITIGVSSTLTIAFSITRVIRGLTAATAYWFDLMVVVPSSNGLTFNSTDATIEEKEY